ncbi:MAG: dihydrolipoamide acetyltransferase family protein [Haloarculaceae archaeon]
MPFEYELPDVGEGVAEGEIVTWHVSAGDTVAEDQVLAEVETDKAVVDLPSPVAGTVVELHAEVGEVVPVGDVVVTIETGAESTEQALPEAEAADTAAGDGTAATEGAASTGDGRVFAPPNVRRLAREHGVDIATVEGSGPGGRVTEADVRAAARENGVDDGAVESAVTSVDGEETTEQRSAVRQISDDGDERTTATDRGGDATAADRDRTLAAPATRRVAREEGVDIDDVPTEKRQDGEPFVEPEDVRTYAEAQQAAQEADREALAAGDVTAATGDRAETVGGEERREPYRGIRRTIGEQMERSKYTAPHVSHHDTAVVPELVETRARLKPRAEEHGVTLTYLPFVLKAIVAGLREHPVLNTSLDEEAEEVVYRGAYNIGVAVATDAGLMVPVVEDVDRKGLLEIATEVRDLADRARERDLAPEEMRGSTFSVTNFGAIGGEYATPIINYPETAILGLGSLKRRPVVADDGADPADTAAGEVVARHTLPLSLSIDHRVIDGAEGAAFVNTVKEYLQEPSLLLLE